MNSDSKKQKLDLKKAVKAADTLVNINEILNDDCLINIFEYLTIDEVLKIEAVCRKWQRLSQFSWSKVHEFKLEDKTGYQYFKYHCNIIRKCGPYLTSINMVDSYNLGEDYSIVMKEIIKYCENITHLKLHGNNHVTFCDDNELASLIRKNKKISSISFAYLSFDEGEFLSYLCADLITEFTLYECCDFSSPDYLYDFISKLKNIKIIHMEDVKDDFLKIISSLEASGCKDINEFVMFPDKKYSADLSNFLSSQTKLSKLKCSYMDKNFFDNLPKCVEELIIPVDEEISKSLCHFENLKTITCYLDNLSDEILKNLTKCSQLKNINFKKVANVTLTIKGENLFSLFENLETFSFSPPFRYKKFDNILKALSKCKKLKELDLCNSTFTNETLESIYLNTNLRILKLLHSTDYDINILTNLIIKLINLEEVEFHGACELNSSFFQKINDAKRKREDKHILVIHLDIDEDDNIESINSFDSDQYPLISLKLMPSAPVVDWL